MRNITQRKDKYTEKNTVSTQLSSGLGLKKKKKKADLNIMFYTAFKLHYSI